MSLDVQITHRAGDFSLEVAFRADEGVTALFGVSGSGKTSVVNAVAGLLKPDSGRIQLGGEVFLDTQTGIFRPPHERHLGYVFQDGRLFPHLTVRQNLAYPGRFLDDPPSTDDVAAIVALLGLGELLDRRPGRLSGGEKSRVAIGRALLSKPAALLMDEPLASLDTGRREELLPYLARLRDETGLPILYVSHARAEVRALANRVVVLTAGRVTAHGPVGEVLGRGGAGPAARLEVIKTGPREAGMVAIETGAGWFHILAENVPVTGARAVTVVASDVVLTTAPREALASPNVYEATVSEVLKAGPGLMDVRLAVGPETLFARLAISEAARIRLAPGQSLRAVVGRFTLN